MPSHSPVEVGINVWFSLVAGVFALVAAFSRVESAVLGQQVWGAFLIALAVGHTVYLWRARWPRGWWPWWLGHAGSALVIGTISLVLAPRGAAGLLLWSIAVWAVLAGASYFLHGVRVSRETAERSDWLLLGAITVLLGLATLVEPVDPVWLVGSAGAWAAIVAVLTGISAVHQVTTVTPKEQEKRV